MQTQHAITYLPSTQVKESKRQFIFDVVNEGGEKEKMELFVNFCEDTIFEMQLAAQMSDAGERSAVKEESEREKPDEENPEMGFFSVTTVRMALLALRYNVMLLIKVRAHLYRVNIVPEGLQCRHTDRALAANDAAAQLNVLLTLCFLCRAQYTMTVVTCVTQSTASGCIAYCSVKRA